MATITANPEIEILLNSELGKQNPWYIGPITRVSSFDSVSTVQTGGTVATQMRYTNDSVNWTEWAPFADIISITPDVEKPYLFQCRLDPTVLIVSLFVPPYILSEQTITATINTIFDHSQPELAIFDNIFDNIEFSNSHFVLWCENIKDKLVKEGIMPEFIERTEDYKEFIEAITCFFALMYAFVQDEFVGLYENKDNLRNYLLQRGMYFCGEETLEELQALANTFYKEIAKRGTIEVEDELRRLLCSLVTDWFMFIFIDPEDTGWNINNTSPTHTGFQNIRNANMMPDYDGPSVEDVNDFELINAGATVFSIIPDIDDYGDPVNALEIDQSMDDLSDVSGIKLDGTDPNWDSKKILIDDNQSFILEFDVYWSSGSSAPRLAVEIYAEEIDGTPITLDTWEAVPVSSNEFTSPSPGTLLNRHTTHYKFKALIYSKSFDHTIPDAPFYSNMTGGRNLQFVDGVKYIYPQIKFQKSSGTIGVGSKVVIKDIRIAPAWFGQSETPNLGIVDFAPGGLFSNSSLIYNFFKNNGPYSEVELKRIIERYLYPAGTTFLTEFLT